MKLLAAFRRLLPALAAGALVSACDGVAPAELADGVTPIVQVLTLSVAPGSQITARLANGSATDWGYNLCGSPRFERRDGDTWAAAPEPLILCTAEVSTLGAGRVVEVSVSVPEGYLPGTYRIKYRLWRDGGETAPESNTFTVD